MMNPAAILSILLCITEFVYPLPQSLVIPSTTTTATPNTTTTSAAPDITTTTPDKRSSGNSQQTEISRFHVISNIQLRYARTVVESQIKNPDTEAQKADFAVVIPDSAFISNFSMIIGDNEFVARVEAKEKAEKIFQRAVNDGVGAGLVSQDPRDSNRFTVSTNVESGQKVVFKLTYDELLDRKNGMYEHAINIDLKQIVEDFKVEILINESLPITTVKVPELLQSNEIDFEEEEENSIAVVDLKIDDDDKIARVVFAPSKEEQQSAKEQSVSGQLVVRYDVDRRNQDSEVQVIDGYFVHYFVPDNLKTLSKHAIFILDTSGSMRGEKIQQLKDSMFTVLNDMKSNDFFNIITFSSGVKHWKPTEKETENSTLEFEDNAVAATEENKKEAIEYVLDLLATGGTNINSAILAGIQLAQEVNKKETLPEGVASMIVFLSDGEATEGETSNDNIKSNVAKANSQLRLPIFSVAFGRGADFQLVKDISQKTNSFAKRVYEGSDAALQLENFYSEISSPVVTNLKFEYVGELADNKSVSETELRTFFKGGQYVVVGKLQEIENGELRVKVTGDTTSQGSYKDVIDICLRKPGEHKESEKSDVYTDLPHKFCLPHTPKQPRRSQAQQFMKSLHAFVNIKQLLKKDDNKAALNLALENNFVTPLTSLVVTRPDEEDSIASIDEGKVVNRSFQRKTGFRNRIVSHSAINNLKRFKAPAPSFDALLRSKAGGSNVFYSSIPSIRRPVTTHRPFKTTSTHRASTTSSPVASNTSIHGASTASTHRAPSSCNGNLTLFSSTYHRGDQVSLLDDSSDLSSFSDQAISATIQGSCCWILYADTHFKGESYRLLPGVDYKTTSSFGRALFRDVSSVRRTHCDDFESFI